VKRHQCFFAGLGFDVFENLLFVVDEKITLLVGRLCYGRHVALLALSRTSAGPAKSFATDVPIDGLHTDVSKQSICDQLCIQY
jgi:hypothetical protein